ncbi:MAG: UDP-N-acetylmuramoyl-L-alanyl-D-glutamate--2,6-diaminopimelate ligase [Oscillibacter sp.]|nr:UDP-N-acetylmuramoyl-L-alanyl-D-glutamate--2,6-diaminopimelate ligase [Oscillibacter sp.]
MKLRKLLEGLDFPPQPETLELVVSGVCYDSRQVKPGDLFVAMPGFAVDGHKFIPQAVAAGAAAVLCQTPPDGLDIPFIQVQDSRRALAVVGANFCDHPADAMTMIGITGTNGKTTTTYLLKAVLERTGKKVGLIGTNQNMIGEEILPTERTTPESFELQKLFAQMRDAGCTHVVMEVSSHALSLDRVYGVPYAVGVFTNLTQDHLDFHGTMESYCDAKSLLFRNCATGVVNASDPWTPRLMKNATCKVLTYGEDASADLRAEDIQLAADHVSFTAVHEGKRVPIRVNIPGHFMVYNTLDVLGAALALGVPLEESVAALAEVPHVKGRVEVVPTPGKDYTILIDYAHSPDSLKNVLTTVKGFAKGRTVALFGCGGDRDKGKRPKMGKIAMDLADFAIVTTDNPRMEAPGAIIEDILTGMKEGTTPYTVIEDRIEAIHWAMDHAQAGDVIVLCGKGHETYQEIGHVKHHMDEREIVADYLSGSAKEER